MKKLIALISVLCMLTAMTACVDIGPADSPTVPQELEFTPYDSWCVVSGIGTCTDTAIVIPNTYNGLPVTSIDKAAFSGCTGLTSITIPEGVTSIGESAFSGCTGLTSITIPKSVTSIGEGAFMYCDNIKDVYISDLAAWCQIDFSLVSNPLLLETMLYINGTLAENIIIPDGVTSIGNNAFMNCSSLISVTVPESVTSISDHAFDGCYNITSITIPEGVTSIGQSAFCFCRNLTSITIPESVTSIGQVAFGFCVGLTSITYAGTVEQWNNVTLGDSWSFDVPATEVICSDGTVSLAK